MCRFNEASARLFVRGRDVQLIHTGCDGRIWVDTEDGIQGPTGGFRVLIERETIFDHADGEVDTLWRLTPARSE